MDADRNLLFGVLALQADLLTPAQFAEACSAWAARKGTLLADLLVERGWLGPSDRADVDKLLQRKLQKHTGDAKAGLAEVTTDVVRRSLAGVEDADVRQSLAGPTPPPRGHVLLATTDHVPDQGERYTLSRLHATGGIGRVWLARDASLGRDVALKELRPERAGQPALWARFLREAQVTGQLEHPGIVPVYEVGRRPDDQAPFYTMRFVRGRTLAEAARAYHERRARGAAGPLELRELLTAFVGVCQAVAYAHSRGVLHRDLKPQNVVLGDYGEVIVLDWGLARVTGEADGDPAAGRAPVALPGEGSRDETLAGQVLGTPAYMAPEQAEGRLDLLDVRTDVYGLGAVLYDVLEGRPPFDGPDTTAVLRRVVHEAPAPPQALAPGVPRALQAVCLKALAKRPAERYAAALALAEDVKRWLADEPVSAYRDPPAVRAVRWARRHRTGVAAAVALAVTALVGLSLGSALLWREERRTRAEYDRAEHEHQAAERNFEALRATVLEMGRQVEEIETGASDPQRSDLKRKAALDTARRQFEILVAESPNDRLLKKQLAALQRFTANLSRLLGTFPEAEESYQASIALWEELARADADDASYRDNLAQTLFDLSTVQKRAGRLREALKTLDRSAALAEEIKDRVPPAFYQRTLGSTLLNRSDVEFRLGDFEAAEKTSGRAVELYDALKDAPVGQANAIDPILAAIAVRNRGAALREMGKVPEALAVLDDAVARTDALAGPNPGRDVRHNSQRSRLERAITRSRVGPDGALREMNEVIADADKLVADFPQAPMYREVVAEALTRRGELTTRTAPDQAAADFDRALLITRELIDKHGRQPDHIGLRGETYVGKGRLLAGEGKKSEAAECFDRAVKVLEIAEKMDPDNFEWRRGLEQARNEAKANPK